MCACRRSFFIYNKIFKFKSELFLAEQDCSIINYFYKNLSIKNLFKMSL